MAWLASNPWVVSVVIPAVLVIGIAIPKKMSRGGDWERSDFYQGLELCWAALAAGLLNFFDLARANPANVTLLVAVNAFYLVGALLVLLWVIERHQHWQSKSSSRAQLIWLAIVCNGLGGGLFVALIVGVKGLS